MREGVPFSWKSLENIITEEKEELLSLFYEEVEDDLNFRVKLDIEAQLVARDLFYEWLWWICGWR